MKKYLIAAVAAALFAASPAAAAGFKGVVVANSGGAIAVAAPSGVVRTVHVRSSARVGAVVNVSGSHVAVVGTARRAVVRGVTVRRLGSTQFLAAGGSMLAVRSRRGLAAVGDTGPAPGTLVQDTVAVNPANGTLTTLASQTLGRQSGTITVQATVASVGTGTITLTINGQSLTLPLPAGLTLPANVVVGAPLTLSLNLGAGTTPTATPGGDENDNHDGDQNDNNGNNSDNHDQTGDHQN